MLTLPSIPLSRGTRPTKKAKSRGATFNDGFVQRHSEGIQSAKQKWTLVWKNITEVQYAELWDFFELHEDGDAFLWTPLWQDTELQWIVKTLSAPIEGWNNGASTFQIEQVFDE